VSELYDHPDLYDALLPLGAHLPFYRELARRSDGPVLELACGAGQIIIPIAADGMPAVGLDSSAAMLDAARKRASATPATVEFVLGDMREFALGRTFSLIFIARNSLLHLLSTEDLIAALSTVRRHLAQDGILAFDIFNPNMELLSRPAGQRFPVMEVDSATFGRLRVEGTVDYEPVSQVNRGTWYVSTAETQDAWVVPLHLRSIFPQQLPSILSGGGLELVERYGELDFSPFVPTSRAQVCLCRRALSTV
jgi:SAM-dependent methyltransferase